MSGFLSDAKCQTGGGDSLSPASPLYSFAAPVNAGGIESVLVPPAWYTRGSGDLNPALTLPLAQTSTMSVFGLT